jgi:hypothetical protein
MTTMDVPDAAQAEACAQNKPSLLRRLWRRACAWLDRIDANRLIGGSDVFK